MPHNDLLEDQGAQGAQGTEEELRGERAAESSGGEAAFAIGPPSTTSDNTQPRWLEEAISSLFMDPVMVLASNILGHLRGDDSGKLDGDISLSDMDSKFAWYGNRVRLLLLR